MSTNDIKYLSGRVKKTPSNAVPTDRYEWLRLNDAEADLGVPSADNSIAASLIDGTRKWLEISTGFDITSDVLTVDATSDDIASKIVARSATNSFGITTIDWTIPETEAAIVEGRLQWNIDEATLDLGIEGDIPLHIGQESLYRVTNKSGSPIGKGILVCAAGTVGNSGKILIEPWDGTQPVQTIMGVTNGAIANDADGYVVHFGKVRGVDTTDFEEGDILYADPNGGLTKTVPQAPNSKTIIALVITKSEQVGEIFVRPTLSSSLANDDLVQLGTLSDNDILVYNGTNSRFENESLTTDIVTEGSNLYYTDARVDAHLSGGTGVTYSAGTISIGQAVGTTDNVQFADITATGTMTHNGLSPTDGFNIDQVKSITKSLTLTQDWQDTGIKSTDIETGTYAVQLYANDGVNINEYYSGMMSWYNGSTQSESEMPTDEIYLHRAGGSNDGVEIYLRTFRSSTADNLKLQIYSNHQFSSASNYVFKFRRLI